MENVVSTRSVDYVGPEMSKNCFPILSLEVELTAGSPLATNGGVMNEHFDEVKNHLALLFVAFPPAAATAIAAAKKARAANSSVPVAPGLQTMERAAENCDRAPTEADASSDSSGIE